MAVTATTFDAGGGAIFDGVPNEEKVSVRPAPEAAAAAEELPEEAALISSDSWTTLPLPSNQTSAGIGEPALRLVNRVRTAVSSVLLAPGRDNSEGVSLAMSMDTLYLVAGTPPTLLWPTFVPPAVTPRRRPSSSEVSNATDQLTNGLQAWRNDWSVARLNMNQLLPAGSAALPVVDGGM